MLLPLSSYGVLYQVEQLSNPAGFVSNTEAIEGGTTKQSVTPSLSTNGYAFGYWKINGVRQTGDDNRSLTQVSTSISANTTFTAYYFNESEDTDSDGIMDWYEYRMFGSLSMGPTDDPDSDGFNNKRESELGQDPLIVDAVEWGGISGRLSTGITYADTSMVLAVVKSDPAGFVNETSNYLDMNSTVTTSSLHGATNGYNFAYWSINGVRQAGPTGVSMSKVDHNITQTTNIIAHYKPSTEDTDGDGVMDWFELYQFGNLTQGPSDDPDGDGFSNKREGELGQEATIADTVEWGGISGRLSPGFTYADNSMVLAVIKSDPAGFVTETSNYLEENSTVTTSSLHGATNGYNFAYWSVNGARQAGPTGVSLSKVTKQVNKSYEVDKNFRFSFAKVFDEGAETYLHNTYVAQKFTANGVAAWSPSLTTASSHITYKFSFPGITNSAYSKITTTNWKKNASTRGHSSAWVSDDNSTWVQILDNPVPNAGGSPTAYPKTFSDLLPSSVLGAKELYIQVRLWSAGNTNNAQFARASSTATQENFIIDVNYTETVENNGTDIIAHYVPSSQDNDGDGVMDWFELYQFGDLNQSGTDDPDGDGFSNKREGELGQEATIVDNVEWGGISGRLSPGILYYQQQNRPPSNLELNNTLVFLNKDANQTVGSFTSTDPDDPGRVRTYTYQLLSGSGGEDNNKFNLLGQNLRTSQILTTEGNFSIQVRVSDDENASFDKNFTIRAFNPIRDDDGDGLGFEAELIAGTNPNNPDTDGDGATDGSEVSANKDPLDPNAYPNRPPRDISAHQIISVDYGATAPSGYQLHSRDIPNWNWQQKASISSARYSPHGLVSSGERIYFIAGSNGNTPLSIIEAYDPTNDKWQQLASLNTARFMPAAAAIDQQVFVFGGKGPSNTMLSSGEKYDPNSNQWAQTSAIPQTLEKAGPIAHDGKVYLVGGGVHGTAQNTFYSYDTTANTWQTLPVLPFQGQGLSVFLFESKIWAVGHQKIASFDFSSNQWTIEGTLPFGGTQFVSWFHGGDYFLKRNGNEIYSINLSSNIMSFAGYFPDNAGLSSTVIHNGSIYVAGGSYGTYNDGNNSDKVYSSNLQTAFENLHDHYVELNSSSLVSFSENQPVGIVIGEFNSADPDGHAISYHFVNGENNNSLFILDTNGTLNTATTFDFETNASTYTITVQAKDELNATAEGNFSISLQNIIEDFDQDGIEDHHDTDDDNDGFTDSMEITYGSDPRDANSTANAPPQITLGSTFPAQLDANGVFQIGHVENLTDIIRVTATDPDGDDLNYSIYGWQDLHHFEINASSGDLRFKQAPDFEELEDHNKDGVYGIVLRVSDGHVHTDQPVWIWLQNENEAPYDLNASGDLQFLEEQPAGTLVGNFSAHDHDANTTLTYSMLDGNGSSGNQYFILDPNGTLTTAQVFDYENNESNYSIRVRVSDEQNASMEGTFVVQLINDPSDDFNSPDSNYTSPNGGYQTPPGDYQSPDGNYSSPSSDYQTPGTDYQSQNDSYEPSPENNQSIPNPISQIYVPIVETFPPDHDGNGTYHLGGQILADGGSSPFEVGIVLSTKISLSDPIRIATQPDQNSSVFHVSYTDLLPGKTYYLRAYAVNQAGENQGSLKKFKTAQKTDPDSWYSEAEALPGGWKMSNWLGAFRPTEHQWIYHAEMGWLYPSPMEDGSLWLWNQTDGWSWTQDGVYPYLFRWKDSAWVYLQGRINGQILYYNYSTQSYE
jgi:hypothetical protein